VVVILSGLVLFLSYELDQKHWAGMALDNIDSRVGFPISRIEIIDSVRDQGHRYHQHCYIAVIVAGIYLWLFSMLGGRGCHWDWDHCHCCFG